MPRRFPIFQFPNKVLIAAMLARGVAAKLGVEAGRGPRNVSNLLALDWAYQEVTEGANWFRQLIGLGGVVYSVRSILTDW